LHERRVRVWLDDGRLHYRAPKGTLSGEDLAKLTKWSERIVALLQRRGASQTALPPLVPRGATEQSVPLSFSQLKYWQAYRLSDRPTVRSVATAVALSGSLDPACLERCIRQVVGRHESLRTRVVAVDGIPLQRIQPQGPADFMICDLTGEPELFRTQEIERIAHDLILAPVHVATGPLFGVRLARVGAAEHVLIVALEHIIADGYSLSLVLRDLLTLYTQQTEGSGPALPQVDIQLADYAAWQRKSHPAWVAAHGAYWQRRLNRCGRLRFPGQPERAAAADEGYGTVPVRIAVPSKETLREWCRVHRTTPVLAVFTAFAAAVLRWCDSTDAVIRYQTDGRISPLIANAIGYFASVLNLRIEMFPADTLLDLLEHVTHEYCAASEHADFSYIDSQVPRPGFTRNSGFNWVPHDPAGLYCDPGKHGALRWRPWQFERPKLEGYKWEDEPSVILFEREHSVDGTIFFAPGELSVAAMELFRDGFLMILQALLSQPEQRVAQIPLRDIVPVARC
jgi:hypothetical protein